MFWSDFSGAGLFLSVAPLDVRPYITKMRATVIHNPLPIAPSLPVVPPQPASALKETSRRGRLLILLLVLTTSVLPFLPSLRYGFVYDDQLQIFGNQAIQKWSYLGSYFRTPIGGFYDLKASRPYYRPLFMLWLRLNYVAFGRHPFGWHFTTLATHILATLFVFALLRHHFGNPRCAVTGAIVFGLHPTHIESVAWISGVTDPLVSLAVLGSLLLWLNAQERPSIRLRSASLLCYAAALLTKEIAVVLPALIFVYAASSEIGQANYRGGKMAALRGATLRTLPYVGMTALYLIVRHYVVRRLYAGPPWVSLHDALLTAPSLMMFYLRHLVWPANLSLFYDFPMVASANNIHFWLPVVFLGGLSLVSLLLWKKQERQLVPVLFAWLFLPLLPVLNIALLPADDFVHDRYLYLPAIGLSLGIALVLKHILQKGGQNWRNTAATAVAALVIAPLAISTIVQSRPWRDNFSLYRYAVEHAPNNALPLNDLGCIYASGNQFDEAADLFRQALARRPLYWNANFNYGYLNYAKGHDALAELYLRRAVLIDPHTSAQYFYLGMIDFKQARLEEAAAKLREAIDRTPDGPTYHLALGLVLWQQGHAKAAKEEFLKELSYHPENATAREQVAAMDRQMGP